jgi:hypothetical protein
MEMTQVAKLYEVTFPNRPGVTFQVETVDEIEANREAQKLAETKVKGTVTEAVMPEDDGYDFAITIRFLSV